MIELPFYRFNVVCPDCQFGCQVIVFNGVNKFAIKPDVTSYARANEILILTKCENQDAMHAMQFAVELAPHSCEMYVIWAEDQATFDLLVKLAQNQHLIERSEDEDDEDGTRKERTQIKH